MHGMITKNSPFNLLERRYSFMRMQVALCQSDLKGRRAEHNVYYIFVYFLKMKELNYKGFAAFDSLGLIAGRVPLVSRERYTAASRGSKGAIKEPFHVRGEGRLASQENSARARGCLSRAPGVVFLGLVRYVFSPGGAIAGQGMVPRRLREYRIERLRLSWNSSKLTKRISLLLQSLKSTGSQSMMRWTRRFSGGHEADRKGLRRIAELGKQVLLGVEMDSALD